jgi:hypothetical protein
VTRQLAAGAAFVLAALSAPSASGAGPAGISSGGSAGPQRFDYVAAQTPWVFAMGVVEQATGVQADGTITVVPAAAAITLHIDDAAVSDGRRLLVGVLSGKGPTRWLCVPVRTTTPIRQLTAGQPVTIAIESDAYGMTCGGIAVAGVATVGGVRARADGADPLGGAQSDYPPALSCQVASADVPRGQPASCRFRALERGGFVVGSTFAGAPPGDNTVVTVIRNSVARRSSASCAPDGVIQPGDLVTATVLPPRQGKAVTFIQAGTGFRC